ncbi:MAG: GNAT family N-acetyltransferase [Spirosomataceae bacterium]
MQQLRYIRKQGAEIASVIDDLAQLRIAVFYDFPYLYEGTIDYERIYLQTYVQAEKAFLFAVYDGDKMVGATTCIPLSNETPEVQEPFVNAGMDVDSIFYFGESILLAAYRGHGLGHRFFDEREAHAASFGTFKQTCFCAVDRGESHPLQPIDYRPNDAFWLKRGYEKTPSLQCTMEWLDRGETQATSKPMIFWTKSLV